MAENEIWVETILSKLRHDKKGAVRAVIKYFKKLDSSKNFDLISDRLSKAVTDYALYKNPQEFDRSINEDYKLLGEISNKKHSLSSLYDSKAVYRYRIEAYILARHFENIEGVVRYPDKDRLFVMDKKLKASLSKLITLQGLFLNHLPKLYRCDL